MAYQRYQDVVATTTDLAPIFVAESQQNIHHINVFAEGVWVMLSAILAAIGLHGLISDRRS